MRWYRKALTLGLTCALALTGLWMGASFARAEELPGTGGVSLPAPALKAASLQPASAGQAPAKKPGLLGAIAANALASAGEASEGADPASPELITLPDDEDIDSAGTVAEMEMTAGMITRWPLENAPIRQALRQLSMMSGKNIIASKDVKGDITADLYNVTWREALDAILRVNGFNYVEEGNFIYVYTAKEYEEIRQARRQKSTRVFHLYYIRPEDAKELIAPYLSGDGTVATSPNSADGISSSDSETGGMDYAVTDVLVIRDYEDILDEIEKLLKKVDVRPQQVLIEATILRATLQENNALGIDFEALGGVNMAELNIATNFTQGVPLNQGGLSIGWINDDFSAFLSALEGVTNTTVLANPKLLVVNKQRGEVIVGRRDGYVTTTIVDQVATQTVEFLETGTRLLLRPYIGQNGYVRMELHPEDSSGEVDAAGLPSESTTECTSNVIVKDGHTIVISGLFREVTTNSRNQVPIVGNIPYAGALFRRSADDVQREEVIILVTPRIIKQAPDEIVSEQLHDDIERVRLGVRQSLACWGRGRMADAYMNWAKDHIAAGRTNRALWDINMALSLSPAMQEALLAKEELTGEAIWENQPRLSSARWIVQKMVMNELDENVNQITYPYKPLNANELPESVREATGIGNTPERAIMEDPTEMYMPSPQTPAVEIMDAPMEAPEETVDPAYEPVTVVPEQAQAEPDHAEALVEGTEEPAEASAEELVMETPEAADEPQAVEIGAVEEVVEEDDADMLPPVEVAPEVIEEPTADEESAEMDTPEA